MQTKPKQSAADKRSLKKLCQHHYRLLTAAIASSIALLILALIFSHNSTYKISHKKVLPLPIQLAENHADKKIPRSPLGKWLSIKVKNGDNLSQIFKREHLEMNQLQAMLALGEDAQTLVDLRPGNEIHFFLDQFHNIEQLVYRPDIETLLTITKDHKKYHAKTEKLTLESRQAYTHGKIQGSLFATAKKNNIPSSLISQLVTIFQWDIDFAKDIQRGDTFSLIYDEFYLNGEKVDTGNIIAAELINHGKTYLAIRFENPNGEYGYYTPTGRSMKRRFTRTPVKFTRISSRFTIKRYHPVLHRIRSHKGVDYAAPTGTPVKATANGKVLFAGRKGGYGNAIILKHGKKYSTLYGHLSKFAKSIHKNVQVKQGQTIGYVGMTGLATGPHLHYEFRINNKHRDPLKVALPKGEPVKGQFKKMYFAHAKSLLRQLLIHDQTEFAAKNTAKKIS